MSYIDRSSSDFDVWRIGDDLPNNPRAYIENLEDLERVRSRVSERNFVAMQSLLRGRKITKDAVEELMRTEEGRAFLASRDDQDQDCEVGHC